MRSTSGAKTFATRGAASTTESSVDSTTGWGSGDDSICSSGHRSSTAVASGSLSRDSVTGSSTLTTISSTSPEATSSLAGTGVGSGGSTLSSTSRLSRSSSTPGTSRRGSGIPPSKTMRSRLMISSALDPRVARVRFAHMVKASSSSSRRVTWRSSSSISSAVLPAPSPLNFARIAASVSEVRTGGAIAAEGAGVGGTNGTPSPADSSTTGNEPVNTASSAGGVNVFLRGPSEFSVSSSSAMA